jgi:hypothetical protein
MHLSEQVYSKIILSDKALFSLISDPDLEGKMLTTTMQFIKKSRIL